MFGRLILALRAAWAGLRHFRRPYAAAAAGALLAAALFTGSLLTGASVRLSLERSAAERLGGIEYALEMKEGFTSVLLAARLTHRLGTPAVPALKLAGQATAPGRSGESRPVAVVGVPDSFFKLFTDDRPAFSLPPLGASAALGRSAADRLGCRAGDEIVLRVEKPSLLPLESVAGRTDDRFFSLRLTVAAVLPAGRGGEFALESNAAPASAVLVPWEMLSRAGGLPGRANLFLVRERAERPLVPADLELPLRDAMVVSDYGLNLLPGKAGGEWEAFDERFFLRGEAEAALREFDTEARGRLVYFANRIERAPYSFMAAVHPADLPVTLAPDEIIVSDWLAADQGLAAGSRVTAAYYAVGPGSALEEREARFRVRLVLPQTHTLFDARRTPSFPGLTDVPNCRDWKAGVPVALDKIRPQDEAFWNRHRAAPKAVIDLEAGQALWADRYGRLTSLALRLKSGAVDPRDALPARLAPARFGFAFTPVRAEARAAVEGGVDFTGLFAALGFCAVAAGLVLAGFLFSASVADRRRELGLLRAVGFSRGRAAARLGLEGAAVALAGSAAGSAAGLGFALAMVLLLRTLFRGAVGEIDLRFLVSAPHYFLGWVGSFLFALAVFGAVLVRESGRPIAGLLAGTTGTKQRRKTRRPWLRLAAGAVSLAFALVLVLGFQRKSIEPVYFFIASALAFAGLLLLLDAFLALRRRASAVSPAGRLARARAALASRRGRTLASVTVIALGAFLVAAVGANTSTLPVDPGARDSGTGGFALWVEAAAPVPEDLNDPAARARLGLADLPAGVSFVPLRVRTGDEASCLNLNRAREPEVVGVDPAALAGRRAFAFAGAAVRLGAGESGWRALLYRPGTLAPSGPVPAAADESSLEWNLGLGLGGELAIRDEAGRGRRLRINAALSGSVFQGCLVVSEDEFLRLYPSSRGYARFLIDAPGLSAPERDRLAARINSGLRAYGAEAVPTEVRLFRYNRTANTYLLMFLILGGLGLAIGIGGFGVFVRRAAAERRGEFALLRAVGFSARDIFRGVLAEQTMIFAAALAVGLCAAFIALLPAVLRAGERLPWAALGLLVLVLAVGGWAWIRRSVRRALRGDIIGILKEE